jgi:hypothetical protein
MPKAIRRVLLAIGAAVMVTYIALWIFFSLWMVCFIPGIDC